MTSRRRCRSPSMSREEAFASSSSGFTFCERVGSEWCGLLTLHFTRYSPMTRAFLLLAFIYAGCAEQACPRPCVCRLIKFHGITARSLSIKKKLPLTEPQVLPWRRVFCSRVLVTVGVERRVNYGFSLLLTKAFQADWGFKGVNGCSACAFRGHIVERLYRFDKSDDKGQRFIDYFAAC